MTLYTRRTTPEDRTFVASMATWQAIAKRVTTVDRRFAGELTKRLEGHPPRDPAIELTFPTDKVRIVMAADV